MRTLTRIIPPRARSRRGLAFSVSLGTLAGGLVVVQAALLAGSSTPAFSGEPAVPRCSRSCSGSSGRPLARAAATWGQEVVAQRFSGAVRVELRDHLVRRLLALGPRYASGERTGELPNTLVGGVDALDAYLAQYLPQACLAGIVPLLILLAVLRADPLSALVLLLTFPLIPLFMWLIGERARRSTERQWVTLSRLSARFLDAVQGLPTLRAFGRARDRAEAIARASDRYRAVTMGVLRLAFVSALVLELLATLGTAIVAVEVGLRLLYGRMAFGQALFVLILAPEFYRPLRALGAAFHAGMAGREAAGRIGELLDGNEPVVAPAVLQRGRAPAVGRSGEPRAPPRLELERVHFSYGEGRAPALDDVSFTVEAGTHRGPGGADRGGQDDGGPPPPSLHRARLRRSPCRRSPPRRDRPRGVAAPGGLGSPAAAALPRLAPREPPPRSTRGVEGERREGGGGRAPRVRSCASFRGAGTRRWAREASGSPGERRSGWPSPARS